MSDSARTQRVSPDGVRTLGGHSLIYAASSFLGQLGALLTFPLYTRALGVEAYGVLALALSASGVLRTFVIAGTNTALMHERISADQDDVPRITGAAFLYVAIAASFLGLLGAFVFPWISARTELPIGGVLVAAIVGYIAVDSLYELVLAVARAESRPADYAYSNALRVGVTFLSAGSLLVLAESGPVGAVIGMAAGSLAAGAWLAWRLRLRPRFGGSARWVPRLLRQGGPLLPANLASWIADLSDRYLLLLLLGSTATVGLYSAGYRIGSLITALFVGPFHTAFLPLMLKRLGSGADDETYGESSRLFLAFGSVVVCALQAVSVPGVLLLAGPAYLGAERVVGVVALGCLLSGATMLMTPSALKSGRSLYLAAAYGAGAVINVALNLLLIPAIGMVGAAAATLAGYAVVLGTMLRLMPRESRPPGVMGTLVRVLPIMAAASVPSMFSFGGPLVQGAVSAGLAGGAVLALAATGVLRWGDVTFAGRSLGLLGRGMLARLVPRHGRTGSRIRGGARAVARTPRTAWKLAAAQVRRVRRMGEIVGGDCSTSAYREYLLLTPEALDRAACDADRIVAGDMVTFAYEWKWHGATDWHLDPISGRRWRVAPAGLVDVNRVVRDSDVQCVWETSRLEHVWRVALAFTRTGDERYAAWVVDRLKEWRRANPLGWGVNWTVSMEVAMRAVAITEARSALCESASWTPEVEHEVCGMLADHVEWVISNLERWGRHTQNHYLASLVGIVAVASHLPDWKRLQHEIAWVYPALFECVEDQVLEDGVNFENSLGYHLLVCELIGYGVGVCRSIGVAVPESVTSRLAGMIRFASAMQFSDGTPVGFGDDDDDFILPSAAAHFDVDRPRTEARIAYAAHAARVSDAKSAVEATPPVSFPDAGVHIMGGRRIRAFINAMPTGVRGTGPHRHNDALSFCLEVDSCPMVVDAGTYRYQSEHGDRNRYRSVVAHNTVQIDDVEQNDLASPFALDEDRIALAPALVEWGSGLQRVSAMHSGYVEETGLRHRRTWEYQDRLLIIDAFERADESRADAGAAKRFVARFHFMPDEEPQLQDAEGGTSPDNRAIVATCGPCRFKFIAENAQGFSAVIRPSTYSPRYRVEVPSKVLELSWCGDECCILRTEISVTDATLGA